jgi:hypothetical protein
MVMVARDREEGDVELRVRKVEDVLERLLEAL